MALEEDQATEVVDDLLDNLKGNNVCKGAYLSMISKRKILLHADIDQDIIETVVVPLLTFEEDDSKEPVYLYINSNGGSSFDSFFITDIINGYKKPLVIVAMGAACSAAFYLLIAGKNNPNVKRICYKKSVGLLHSGSMSIEGDTGKIKDIVYFNNRLDDMSKEFVLANTTLNEEEYEKHERDDWYFTSEDMLKYSMVDEILS